MATWKVFNDVKHISGAASKSKAKNYGSYVMRDKECVAIYKEDGRTLTDRQEIDRERQENKAKWERSLALEKRSNSRLQSRDILPIPNDMTQQQKNELAQNLRNYITDNGKRDINLDIVEHRGEKNGVENRHFHVNWNDRDLTTGKKIREFQDKKFLEGYKQTVGDTLEKQNYKIVQNDVDTKRDRVKFSDYEILQRKGKDAPELRGNKKVERYIEQKAARDQEKQIRKELAEVRRAKTAYQDKVRDQWKERMAKIRGQKDAPEQRKDEAEIRPTFSALKKRLAESQSQEQGGKSHISKLRKEQQEQRDPAKDQQQEKARKGRSKER